MRRTGRIIVVALATSLAGLGIAEIAAQIAPPSAEPFRLPASETPAYLPWTKICGLTQDTKVCLTRSDGRLPEGATTVSIQLFEQPGKSDLILRITLPHNLMIGPGTRVVIDAGDPMRAAFVACEATAARPITSPRIR